MSALAPELLELVLAARAVREHAYAPYSSFFVGAALRTRDGEVFIGCNVENASYGATICAERAAICAMVAQAKRTSTRRPLIATIAVFTDAAELAMPCGVCRQVLSEFADRSEVVVANPREQRVISFAELFPAPFVLRGGDES
ncbi:MAG TPA: cytidine deaminase [Polyangiaceae bacterium]|nr:cytidine deaminase [Polyangiaceae bacterium]